MKYLICIFCLFTTTLAISQEEKKSSTLPKHLLEYETSFDKNLGLNVGLNYAHLLNENLALTAGFNVSYRNRSSYQLGLRAYMKNTGIVKPFYEIGYNFTRLDLSHYDLPITHGHFIYQKFGIIADLTDRFTITGAIQYDKKMSGPYVRSGFSQSISIGYKF